MGSDNDSVLLTYVELADRLSIKAASAKRLAQRRKWHRVIGNDGIARVHVPISSVPVVADVIAPDSPQDMSPDVTPSPFVRIAYLEGIIEGLQGQLEAEQRLVIAQQQKAEAAEARVKDISADRESWKRQAQRSIWSRFFGSK